ncbi:CsbD family protein [Streptomyces sp. NPDC005181]|uniref:CsbD family protein n=1 Tax=Streptomyces sp. NPDC005181 TaxID=3156869 RepID=UPI0033B37D3D
MAHGSGKDKIKGKAKEAIGKLTGDRGKVAEGKADQLKGRAKEAADDARKNIPGKT